MHTATTPTLPVKHGWAGHCRHKGLGFEPWEGVAAGRARTCGWLVKEDERWALQQARGDAQALALAARKTTQHQRARQRPAHLHSRQGSRRTLYDS